MVQGSANSGQFRHRPILALPIWPILAPRFPPIPAIQCRLIPALPRQTISTDSSHSWHFDVGWFRPILASRFQLILAPRFWPIPALRRRPIPTDHGTSTSADLYASNICSKYSINKNYFYTFLTPTQMKNTGPTCHDNRHIFPPDLSQFFSHTFNFTHFWRQKEEWPQEYKV